MDQKIEHIELDYLGHKIATYATGEGPETLLFIAGGPGCPCNLVRDTHQLYAQQGFRVVTWDQLGCGLSDHPEDAQLWQIPRFVNNEVEFIRQSLNLGTVHLLGHSWGGVLGLEYTLAHPDTVKTFIITNSAFNLQLMQRGFERIKMTLGYETMRMMAHREANHTTEHEEYQAACTLLMRRHLCRLEHWPDCLKASMNISKRMLSPVFGHYLFNCTGLLKDYDRTNDLCQIQQPCLIIQGAYDYIIVECATLARDYLPNAQLHVLDHASHTPCIETPEPYHHIVMEFLAKHKTSRLTLEQKHRKASFATM